MILTIKGADFSGAGIGTNNSIRVQLTKTSGVSGSIVQNNFEKDQVVSTATVIANLAVISGYENLTVTVTMGGTSVNAWYSNGVVTIPSNTTISGDIKISASATAVSGGEEPDEPVTPTMYTFTINPTPTTATVTLTASGYTQSGNSITVKSGTVVTWKVSASGYTEQNGTHTVIKTESKSVALRAVSGGNTGGGSVEDETGITWYIDNVAQANKNFNYTTTFPGAALIAEDKVEALRNVPINVIKFMPSGKPSSGITGKFAFVKLTQGTEPSASDIYYIDIPVEDMYETAPSNDAVARTYILNTPITLNENEYLVMNYVGATGRTAGFWVNAGGQPDYKVGTYDRTNHTLKTENWGFPFSIGYKS